MTQRGDHRQDMERVYQRKELYMGKQRRRTDGAEVRLMTRQDAQEYCGLGRMVFTDWARSIGAERRFGRRVLFDRLVIDEALNAMRVG